MIPQNIAADISVFLSNKLGGSFTINSSTPTSGGCINNGSIVNTNNGSFFVKWNDANRFPSMFEKEAKGLAILKDVGHIRVPEVVGFGESEDNSWLILEYIQEASKSSDFFEDFGRALAALHKESSEKFGLDHDNYIGSLPQNNTLTDKWIDFFVSQRIEKQIKLARDNGLISDSTIKKFSGLYHYLVEFFPVEPPSLLHGDLWGGNFMTGADGKACIIDPAVYYGHRFMDIGMSQLFGGFSQSFYDAYNDAFPMGKNWEYNLSIANLYPLMVHVNLFGSSYMSQVENILKRF